jgi:hypothetical protein
VGGQSPLIEYCFSAGGNCANIIIKWIDPAKMSGHVPIYSFTLGDVADALFRAKNRGLGVRVVLERERQNEQDSGHRTTR